MVQQSVQRKSLTEQIKSILIERIVDGSLMPGDRLKELQIANEFGTSQAPVREALRSLQALGYVEHKAHVGAVVKKFSKKEIEEAYQIREALEAHCLTLPVQQRKEMVKELRKQLASMREAIEHDDFKRFTHADNQFHRAIVEYSNNNRMLEVWESLKMQLQVIATLTETAVPLETVYRLHPPIVDALESNNQEESARCLTKHYRATGRYWEKHG